MLRRFEEFSYVVSEIYHCIQRIERDEMEKYGLKGPHAQYLVAMSRCPEGVTAAKLGELCDRDKAAVSRALNELESRGLIRRGSGYRAPITLTDTGSAAAQYVCDKVTQAVAIAGGQSTEEERAVLYPLLRRIAASLQTIAKDGLPDQTLSPNT